MLRGKSSEAQFNPVRPDDGVMVILGGEDIRRHDTTASYEKALANTLVTSLHLLSGLVKLEVKTVVVVLPYVCIPSPTQEKFLKDKKQSQEIAEPLSKHILSHLQYALSGKNSLSESEKKLLGEIKGIPTEIQHITREKTTFIFTFNIDAIQSTISAIRKSKTQTHLFINAHSSRRGCFLICTKGLIVAVSLLPETTGSKKAHAILTSSDSGLTQVYITSPRFFTKNREIKGETSIGEDIGFLASKNIKLLSFAPKQALDLPEAVESLIYLLGKTSITLANTFYLDTVTMAEEFSLQPTKSFDTNPVTVPIPEKKGPAPFPISTNLSKVSNIDQAIEHLNKVFEYSDVNDKIAAIDKAILLAGDLKEANRNVEFKKARDQVEIYLFSLLEANSNLIQQLMLTNSSPPQSTVRLIYYACALMLKLSNNNTHRALSHYTTGILNAVEEKFQAAANSFTEAIKLTTDNPTNVSIYLYYRAVSHEKLNNLPAALADLKEALTIKSDFEAAKSFYNELLASFALERKRGPVVAESDPTMLNTSTQSMPRLDQLQNQIYITQKEALRVKTFLLQKKGTYLNYYSQMNKIAQNAASLPLEAISETNQILQSKKSLDTHLVNLEGIDSLKKELTHLKFNTPHDPRIKNLERMIEATEIVYKDVSRLKKEIESFDSQIDSLSQWITATVTAVKKSLLEQIYLLLSNAEKELNKITPGVDTKPYVDIASNNFTRAQPLIAALKNDLPENIINLNIKIHLKVKLHTLRLSVIQAAKAAKDTAQSIDAANMKERKHDIIKYKKAAQDNLIIFENTLKTLEIDQKTTAYLIKNTTTELETILNEAKDVYNTKKKEVANFAAVTKLILPKDLDFLFNLSEKYPGIVWIGGSALLGLLKHDSALADKMIIKDFDGFIEGAGQAQKLEKDGFVRRPTPPWAQFVQLVKQDIHTKDERKKSKDFEVTNILPGYIGNEFITGLAMGTLRAFTQKDLDNKKINPLQFDIIPISQGRFLGIDKTAPYYQDFLNAYTTKKYLIADYEPTKHKKYCLVAVKYYEKMLSLFGSSLDINSGPTMASDNKTQLIGYGALINKLGKLFSDEYNASNQRRIACFLEINGLIKGVGFNNPNAYPYIKALFDAITPFLYTKITDPSEIDEISKEAIKFLSICYKNNPYFSDLKDSKKDPNKNIDSRTMRLQFQFAVDQVIIHRLTKKTPVTAADHAIWEKLIPQPPEKLLEQKSFPLYSPSPYISVLELYTIDPTSGTPSYLSVDEILSLPLFQYDPTSQKFTPVDQKAAMASTLSNPDSALLGLYTYTPVMPDPVPESSSSSTLTSSTYNPGFYSPPPASPNPSVVPTQESSTNSPPDKFKQKT